MMEIADDALKFALKYSDNVEVYVEKENSMDIDIQKNMVSFAKEDFSYGIGVRIIVEGKMGFSYTTNIDKINETVENAVFNSKSNIADENFVLAQKSKYEEVKGILDKKIESLQIEEYLEFAKTMVNAVEDANCEPTSGGVSAGYGETLILNSNDVYCHDKSSVFSGFIAVNAEENGEISTAYEGKSSRNYDVDPLWIAENASKIARDSLKGESIETKDIDVLLDYRAASGLLGSFINALNADNVQRGRSIFANEIGNEVVSSALNIYDDGTHDGGLGSSKCDGEGTPSQKTPIIEDGVLKNFIYDLYTAKKGNTESTGNGMRASFADMPAVSLSNFILEFKDLVEIPEIEEGVLVTDVLGAHTANPISGDFSVEANNAFKIENGEIRDPVKKAMLSGNIFGLMKDASGVSGEIRQMGPFVIPRILARDLRVIG